MTIEFPAAACGDNVLCGDMATLARALRAVEEFHGNHEKVEGLPPALTETVQFWARKKPVSYLMLE